MRLALFSYSFGFSPADMVHSTNIKAFELIFLWGAGVGAIVLIRFRIKYYTVPTHSDSLILIQALSDGLFNILIINLYRRCLLCSFLENRLDLLRLPILPSEILAIDKGRVWLPKSPDLYFLSLSSDLFQGNDTNRPAWMTIELLRVEFLCA